MAKSEPTLETTEVKDPGKTRENEPHMAKEIVARLEMPADLTAAIKKAIAPVPQIDERALEERILVKAKREVIKLLVTADVLPKTLLDQYEQSNAAILNPDNSNIAKAAFGALSRPPQETPSVNTQPRTADQPA